ncbi:hypothetical protein BH23PLA1_BH23PLA1_12010 [soil metagenome]
MTDIQRRAESAVKFSRLIAPVAATLAAIWLLFAIFDRLQGVSTLDLAVGLVIGLGVMVMLPLFVASGRDLRRLMAAIALLGLFIGSVVGLRYMDWDMRKPFLRAYHRIEPGMTIEQVDDLMRWEFRGNRPSLREESGGAVYILDPADPRFKAEIILIKLLGGRVVSAAYLVGSRAVSGEDEYGTPHLVD